MCGVVGDDAGNELVCGRVGVLYYLDVWRIGCIHLSSDRLAAEATLLKAWVLWGKSSFIPAVNLGHLALLQSQQNRALE